MEFDQRIMSPQEVEPERKKEVSLRPQSFTEFIGQKKVRENIDLMVESARKRETSMDHCLLSGPPGLGKTSLAMLVANALGSDLHVLSGPAIDKKADLAAVLTGLKERDVLFIDEIHRLPIAVEEVLYSAMEDFRLDIVIGQGPAARTMQIDLSRFTLIGATTRAGLLSNPLRDRFIASLNFDYYQPQELEKIVAMNAKKIKLPLEAEALKLISQCSRGTPRIANRILNRVRDYYIVYELEEVSNQAVQGALSLMEIDRQGLDAMDRKILNILSTTYKGGPVGIEALCATLGQDRGTVEDVYEPFLLKNGYLARTPRGRMLTDKGRSQVEEGQ